MATYEGDLKFFRGFVEFKNGKISEEDWCRKGDGAFKQFLDYYRVARNTTNDKTAEVLRCAMKSKEVDELAEKMKEEGLTHGKRAASLASKVMYLMYPQEIIPMDSLTRRALKTRPGNIYADFFEDLIAYKRRHERTINEALNRVTDMLNIIERPFEKDLEYLPLIRTNRFLDKWLWVQGASLRKN